MRSRDDEIGTHLIPRLAPHDLARVGLCVLQGIVDAKSLARFQDHHGQASLSQSPRHQSTTRTLRRRSTHLGMKNSRGYRARCSGIRLGHDQQSLEGQRC